MSKSLAEQVAALPQEERLIFFEDYTEEQFEALKYDAKFWLRPEQMIPDGDWFITALISGRGFGKLTSVYDKMPTPDGWKYLKDIKDGDKIFDEQGKPCTVLKAHPIQVPEKAYRLTFSDGTHIDAGSEHLWTTWTSADRKSYNRRNDYNNVDTSVGIPSDWPVWTKPSRWGYKGSTGPKTRTTQEIVDTFTYGKRGDLNHSIPVTAPLQYKTRNLPIHPYLLGSWLGDGFSNGGSVCGAPEDLDYLEEWLIECGYEIISRRKDKPNCDIITVKDFRKDLRKNNLLNNKHIPKLYLRGSILQRKALLAGLLDTDGSIHGKNGHIEFVNTNKSIADGVMEILRSLGEKPVMAIREYDNDNWKNAYRITVRPKENYFTLPRKAERLHILGNQASRNYHRMIISYEEIPAPPMRCLTVDSPHSLYLIGEAMVPTHNTFSMSQWIRRKALENPGCRIAIGGRTSQDVRRIMVEGDSGILAVHHPDERPIYKQQKAALYWPNGSMAELHSSEAPDAARGVQYHFGAGDEFASWKSVVDASGATLYSNLIAAIRLGDNPQLVLGTTPKRTKPMKDIFERAKDPEEKIVIVTGTTRDNTTLSKTYIKNLERQYGNSDLARQEIEGQMLGDAEGLFFTDEMIEKSTIPFGSAPHLPLKFIAVDPSVAENPNDECGIIAVGVTGERHPHDRTAYILEDYSLRASPEVWIQAVVDAAREHNTRFIVVEGNQGKQLLQMAINTLDSSLKVFLVHASTGKHKRAEPVVIAMQQGRVKIVDNLPTLTDQLIFFDPENTKDAVDDRMDAMVHGVVAGLISPPEGLVVSRHRVTSPAKRKLPGGLGTGRNRTPNTMRNRRK